MILFARNEDEFTIEGEPDWWPEFEREFADHVDF